MHFRRARRIYREDRIRRPTQGVQWLSGQSCYGQGTASATVDNFHSKPQRKMQFLFWEVTIFLLGGSNSALVSNCSTTGKPTRSFATERVSLDSV
jgi:hypothetical protein